MKGTHWTPADDARLLASDATDAELAELFDRSIKAIRDRRYKLMERGKGERTLQRKIRGRFGVNGKFNTRTMGNVE